MIVLTQSGGETLRLTLGSALNVDYSFFYIDSTDTPGLNRGTLGSTTPTDVVASPGSGQRMIKSGFIANRDTTAVVVTIEIYATTGRRQVKWLIYADGTLQYEDGRGWYSDGGATRIGFGVKASPSIGADQNDWAQTANVIRVTATTSGRNITGLVAGVDGEIRVIENVGSLFVTLKNESVSSSAANRFSLGSTDISLWTGDSATFEYDSSSQRWRCVGKYISIPSFQAYRTTSVQTISSLTLTKVQLNAENFDSHSWFDSTTNYRYQPLLPGKYLFSWCVGITSLGDGKILQTQLVKNGSGVAYGTQNPNGAAADAISTGNKPVSMNGNSDYVELHVYHDHGSSRDIFAADSLTFLSGVFVSF